MKLTGKVLEIAQSEVTSKKTGEVIKVAEVHVEEQGVEYPKSVVLQVFGTERVEKELKYTKVGDVKEFEINAKVKEYNGRKFNSLSLWRSSKVEPQEEGIDGIL